MKKNEIIALAFGFDVHEYFLNHKGNLLLCRGRVYHPAEADIKFLTWMVEFKRVIM